MLELRKLRSHLKPCSPIEMLEYVTQTLTGATLPEDFQEPLFTIYLKSGAQFKAHLVGNAGKTFVFSLMIEKDIDTARDLMYVTGDSIEAVVAWDIDDYAKLLPLNKK